MRFAYIILSASRTVSLPSRQLYNFYRLQCTLTLAKHGLGTHEFAYSSITRQFGIKGINTQQCIKQHA